MFRIVATQLICAKSLRSLFMFCSGIFVGLAGQYLWMPSMPSSRRPLVEAEVVYIDPTVGSPVSHMEINALLGMRTKIVRTANRITLVGKAEVGKPMILLLQNGTDDVGVTINVKEWVALRRRNVEVSGNLSRYWNDPDEVREREERENRIRAIQLGWVYTLIDARVDRILPD